MSLAWLKVNALLGSIGKFAGASLLLASLGLTACGDDPVKAKVAHGCKLNSDCSSGLVCSFSLCHEQCKNSLDCASDQRCVQSGEDKANVCQLKVEAKCNFNSDCDNPLVCAIDRQCRNECQGDKDCLKGQSCVENICADAKEIDENGMLIFAGGAGNTPDETPKDCEAGKACHPDGDLCKLGSVHCSAEGEATCESEGDEDDGTECGTDQVCSAGACTDCVVGTECQADPDNTCLSGELSCANGPECMVSGNIKAGTSCGSDKVCDSGECLDCVVGSACDPKGEACKNGLLSCTKGPVCNATTNKDAGAECGTGMVCDSAAVCTACVQDGPCAPTDNTCHTGTQDCKAGPICNDAGLPATDGLACMGNATYNFCSAGSCLACQNGNPCIPANPCHTGTLNCATEPPTCVDSTANAVDGLACADGKSCISGDCLTNDRVLSVTSGAVADTPINGPFTGVSVKLVDKNGEPVTGATVTVTASAGAYATSTNTNLDGVGKISGRVSRAVGANKFTIAAPGATSLDFTVSGIAPTGGHVLTYVNVDHTSAYTSTPSAGTIAKLYYEAPALAAAADGTLYVAGYCTVFKLSPQGVLTRIAGDANSSCGDTGDNGPGTSAKLYTVRGLALDEQRSYLFIAQQSSPRVRILSLKTGKILPYAGDPTKMNVSPWGDDQTATLAYVNPAAIAVAPDGRLFISDSASSHVRYVDADGTNVHTLLAPGTCTANGPLTFYSCNYYGDGCHFAWDKEGQLFLSATFCGDGQSAFDGVARVKMDGNNVVALTRIAGAQTGSVPDDVTANNAQFSTPPDIAFDQGGNLYLATRQDNRICRIDSLTDRVVTIGGKGGAQDKYSGEYVPGTDAEISHPTTLAFDGNNNLYFSDSANVAIRGLWNVGSTTAGSGKLALTAGNNQTVKRDAPFGANLTVTATDSNDVAIDGVSVLWTRQTPGSALSSGGDTVRVPTNLSGVSSMTGRAGLASGDYKFQASYQDIHGVEVSGSPQIFSVTAEDPTAGHIFTVMNTTRANVSYSGTGAATLATLYNGTDGVVAASDGTIYVSDNYAAVYKVTPAGEVAVFAGTPGSAAAGSAGDSGPAAAAKLYYPNHLALDETRQRLYIADSSNYRIRAVSLDTTPPKISTLVGGAADTTGHGDGGQATLANLAAPYDVSVGPDGTVYIPDVGREIRAVPVTGGSANIISAWVTTAGCVKDVISLYSVNQYTNVRFAPNNGDAYVSGYFCQGVDTNATYAIASRAANGTFTRIAGLYQGGTGDDIDAISANLPDTRDFAIDTNGNIYIAVSTGTAAVGSKIRRIDAGTKKITTVAGTGTSGFVNFAGYVSATTADLSAPSGLSMWKDAAGSQHVIIADSSNRALRMIW